MNTTMQLKPITVDVKGVMELFNVGRNKAYELGKEAGAEIKLGSRRLYSVKKIESYLESMAGV